MMIKTHSHFKVFSMLLIFTLFPVAYAGNVGDCSKLLQKRDATDDLKGFLGISMERQVIGDEGLMRLIEGLEGEKLYVRPTFSPCNHTFPDNCL
ncbi:MAG: hypothetical protein OXB88_08460 [Bacteriovoracales bacterium]|nr:hypothetical protein [Bacteriovoracales bacterium]